RARRARSCRDARRRADCWPSAASGARRTHAKSESSAKRGERRRVGDVSADVLEKEIFEGLAGGRAAQLGNRSLRDQLPFPNDADVIAQPLDDLEDVRGQEDGA